MHSDPQSGAWYPITWLLSFINEYGFYSISIELCLHFFIGGLGMFLLGRTLKIKDSVAFIMGMSYMFSGFMVGTSQILVMIIAASWLPFSLNYLLKALKEPSFKNIFILAFIQFLSLTGSYPAMTIILIYFYITIAIFYLFKVYKGTYSFKKLVLVYGSLATLLLLLSGAYLLSIYEALPFMTRAGAIPYDETLFGNVAFTFQSFLSFILPYALTANTEVFKADVSMSNGYFGIFMFIIMLSGIIIFKDYRNRIAFLIGAFFLLISVGMQSPVHYFFYKLVPGFNLFRHPSIFRIYAIFFFIISAGFSIQFFIDKDQKEKQIEKILKGSLVFFGLVVILAAIKTNYTLIDDYWRALISLQEKSPFNLSGHIFIQGSIQFLLLLIAYCFLRKKKLNVKRVSMLIFIDLFLALQLNAPRTLYYRVLFKDVNEYYNSMPKGLTNQSENDLMREINNKSVLPKQKAMYNNLNSYAKRTAYDGYNPFKFQGLMDLRASGLMKSILNNPLFYVASELRELNTINPNDSIKGIAYLSKDLASHFQDDIAKGELMNLEISSNEFSIEYNLSEGGLIFLNQNYNGNWKAFVNNEIRPIYKANVCLMAIDVPSGKHTLNLVYESRKVKIASILSLITLIGGFTFLLIQRFRKQENELV